MIRIPFYRGEKSALAFEVEAASEQTPDKQRAVSSRSHWRGRREGRKRKEERNVSGDGEFTFIHFRIRGRLRVQLIACISRVRTRGHLTTQQADARGPASVRLEEADHDNACSASVRGLIITPKARERHLACRFILLLSPPKAARSHPLPQTNEGGD